jgi:aqualysin 1
MKSHKRTTTAIAAVAGAALLAVSCSNEPTPPSQARGPAPFYDVKAPGKPTDRYIVVLVDTVTNVRETARRIALAHGGVIRHIYDHVLGGFSVTLPPQAIEVLRADPAVRSIQQVEEGAGRFGDHSWQTSAPWGLDRIDQRNLPLNAVYLYAETGSGVRIYIIDSGIRTGHAQFGGRASIGFDARPQDGLNGQDCHGHGTHVAGIAAGQTYGVAKSASLVAVKVNAGCLNSIDTDDEIAGINWVAGNHTKPAVANISIWGPANANLDQAVNDAVGLGVTFAVIAGNATDNACNYSPARAAQAITVGATTSTDARAGFSNVGACVDIFAPGENILSAWATSNTATQTLSGTSQASPHVAGTVARYLQFVPAATPSNVASALSLRATQGVLTNIGTGSPNLLLHSNFNDASISGPSKSDPCGTHTWFAAASGVGSSFNYIWDKWLDTGFPPNGGRWWQVGSGPSYTAETCPSSIRLRLTATDEFGFHRLAYY